jgi:perosamine synthetase
MEKKFKDIIGFIRSLYQMPSGFIPLHAPVFAGNEKKYLEECIDSTFVSSVGKFVDEFEIKMAEYTGAKKAVVCVNGTNALHLALMLVGVERNTEVITQPLTFIATANAISYCGARPVFLDVDMDTMGLSPNALRSWLEKNVEMREVPPTTLSAFSSVKVGQATHKPFNLSTLQPFNSSTGHRISACVPMHTFGHPCRIDEIIEICNEYNIPVVEDAAESLGSYYKGKHTGTFGKVGVLSFNGNKIITTGGGGMLLFQDEDLAKKAKHLTTQAKVPHPWEFMHDEIGYNYRMPNINAALGLAQLEQLPGFLENKRLTAEKYKSFFSMTNFKFFSEPEHAISNYWLNVVLLNSRKDRDEFLKYSNDNGVMTRPSWEMMNKLPMFKTALTGDLKNAENLTERLVNIPSSVL